MTQVVFVIAVLSSSAQAVPGDSLTAARRLYNDGAFVEAAARAEEARAEPELANAAAVVLGRSLLEQYRQTRATDVLSAARQALQEVDPVALSARDHVEYLVGAGVALYLDDPPRYAAAAELFEAALTQDVLEPEARELAFTWWAGSLDRQAKFGPQAERRPIYVRLLAGAEGERLRNDQSAAAWYWLVMGARGIEDLDRAFGLAIAGWIRAIELGPRGEALRFDLDRLVTEVVLPERARQLAAGGDPRPELTVLQAQWRDLKTKWP